MACRTYPSLEGAAAQQQPRLLYSRREAAYQLSLSARSLDYLIANGELKVRRIGSRILVPHEELVRFAGRDHIDGVAA
jgi:excisionase family DNA binding protein